MVPVCDLILLAFMITTHPPQPPDHAHPTDPFALIVAGELNVNSHHTSIINSQPPFPPAEEVPETSAPPPAPQYPG